MTPTPQIASERTGVLLVAHGSSTPQSETAIRHFENLVRVKYPSATVRWAFTSDQVRERLVTKGKKQDSVTKALQRMTLENIKYIKVLPLFLIAGVEYEDLFATLEEFKQISIHNPFPSVHLSPALLHTEERITPLATALIQCIPKERAPDEAVIFMGHGSPHSANDAYESLDKALKHHSPLFHVATLAGAPYLDDVLPKLSKQAKLIWLIPILALIGNHALKDMASDAPHSWRSRLIREGFEPQIQLTSMLEHQQLCELWLTEASLMNL